MIKAVIFDMDGVLADSEPLYLESINKILAGYHSHMTESEYKDILGETFEHSWDVIIQRYMLPYTRDYWLAKYDTVVEETLSTKVQPSPGLHQLLAEITRRRLPKGLASSSKRIWVMAVLRALGLEKEFRVIITGEEVKNGKPHPEIFQTAANLLDAAPRECLVIEDSPVGIMAAKTAGTKVVALRTPYTTGMDLSRADRVIDSLAHFDYSLLD